MDSGLSSAQNSLRMVMISMRVNAISTLEKRRNRLKQANKTEERFGHCTSTEFMRFFPHQRTEVSTLRDSLEFCAPSLSCALEQHGIIMGRVKSHLYPHYMTKRGEGMNKRTRGHMWVLLCTKIWGKTCFWLDFRVKSWELQFLHKNWYVNGVKPYITPRSPPSINHPTAESWP